uniref:RNA-directed RNA polymerase n=1 Tax=Uromyces potyvirus A TaxID=2592701 RepID=A0A7G3W8T6_9VIRU|nr:polyprotein [Uromyces potyvirus A]
MIGVNTSSRIGATNTNERKVASVSKELVFSNDIPWKNLNSLNDDFDDEYAYLNCFVQEKRNDLGRTLGPNPRVGDILGVPCQYRLLSPMNLEDFIQGVSDTFAKLTIENTNVWSRLYAVYMTNPRIKIGQELATGAPESTDSGYCYLVLFSRFEARNVSKTFGPYPRINELVSFTRFTRENQHYVVTNTDTIKSIFHVEFQTCERDTWSYLLELDLTHPQARIGANSIPTERKEDISRSSQSPQQLEYCVSEIFVSRPSSRAVTPINRAEEELASSSSQLINEEMNLNDDLNNKFSEGFCYLGLFREEFRNELRARLGPSPSIEQLMTMPVSSRDLAIGSIEKVYHSISNLHICYLYKGSNLWFEINNLYILNPSLTVGADREINPIPMPQRARFKKILKLIRWFFDVSLPTLCLVYFVRGAMFDLMQTYFSIAFIFLAFASAIFFDTINPSATRWIMRQLPCGMGEFLSLMLQSFTLSSQGSYTTLVFFYMGFLMRTIATAILVWRQIGEAANACRDFSHFLREATVSMVDTVRGLLQQRTYQSSQIVVTKWVKSLVNCVAYIVNLVALSCFKGKKQKDLESIATSLRTIAQTVDVPAAVENLFSKMQVEEDTIIEEADHIDYSGFDILDEDGQERVYQSADEIPSNAKKHLVTRGNIDTIGKRIFSDPLGAIHIITAATGTGKSTAVPYYLSQQTRKNIFIIIPNIAATHSSAKVIKSRFGVKPHVRADSQYIEGETNIWLCTAKSFAMQLITSPSKLSQVGAIIFDEMHVNNAENDLFRNLSPRICQKIPVIWSSATFASSFTLPSDLTYRVYERIAPDVTLEKIFTKKATTKGVSLTTVYGRYLVFCASIRDTEIVRNRFKRSKIQAFSISSVNYQSEMPKVEKALKDINVKTIIVAATPCLETGVTLPFNYVIDLREQITSKMTYDPCCLSTQRVPVTHGMAVQRKGRVGRVMQGIYIAPPVKFTPVTTIDDSNISLAWMYAKLFNYPPPVDKEFPHLKEKLLTNSFISNVFGTMMDPIAVAGMTTPEGRIFQSFKSFEYPARTSVNSLIFSKAYFPQEVWEKWSSFETSEWKQFLKSSQRWQSGTSVRAPFWDYTVDDKTQIDNWQLKVLCYKGKMITDPVYNDPEYLKTTWLDGLRKNWVTHSNREFQSFNLERDQQFPNDYRWSHLSWKNPRPSAQDDYEVDEADEFENPREFRVPKETFINHTTFWAGYLTTLSVVEVVVYFIVVATVLLYICTIGYGFYQGYTKTSEALERVQSRDDEDYRKFEKEAHDVPPTKPNPKRPWEGKRKSYLPSGTNIDLEDMVAIGNPYAHDVHKANLSDIQEELVGRKSGVAQDLSFLDEEPNETWFQTPTQNLRWDEMHKQRRVIGRSSESALNYKTPIYSLKAVRSSVVTVLSKQNGNILAYAVIFKNFIFLNRHVLAVTSKELWINGMRGEFKITPQVVLEHLDMVVLILPNGIAGSSHNLTIREPIEGEEVSLVRYNALVAKYSEPTPSETSYATPEKEGLYSYIINTQAGDCGTPVIATKDGAMVGIHSMGGAPVDQANFMVPISSHIVDELHRRMPQYRYENLISLPSNLTAYDLHGASRVNVNEQNKHPITPLKPSFVDPQFDPVSGGFLPLACLSKHVSRTSKITIDQEALEIFKVSTKTRLSDVVDYLPSDLSTTAYWKDVSKYHRGTQILPEGFQKTVIDFFQQESPWIFEKQKIIDINQVYFEIDKQKSSGPRLTQKKGFYMSMDNSTNFIDLIKSCENIYNCDPKDFVPLTWQVAIKDELRDRDRVCQLKTRTFMSAPIETILGNVRIVSAFNQRFIENCLQFPSTLGINKFSRGWDDLASYLGRDDYVYMSGDGSRFDSSISIGHLSLNCYLRMMSLPEKYANHIRNLYNETAFTPLVMADGIIRLKTTGNPSGSINTSIDNSISLQATIYWSLSDIFGTSQALKHLKEKKIRFVVNGDDLAISIHKELYKENFRSSLASSMLKCGMNYTFTTPSDNIEQLVYLSHQFKSWEFGGEKLYIPCLDSQRIVATCLFRKKTDAVATHSRYTSALIHSLPYPKLYQIVLQLIVHHSKRAMLDRHFLDDHYSRKFPFFTKLDVLRLYGFGYIGSQDKTYSDKNKLQKASLVRRVFQMATLEREHNPKRTSFAEELNEPIQEAGPQADVVSKFNFNIDNAVTSFAFAKNMDSTIGDLFSKAVSASLNDRVIIAKSSQQQVNMTISHLRDLLSIDDTQDMQRFLVDLMMYYADNSTSEQNPHTLPYEWKGQQISFYEIDKCFVPSPRKFWRAVADATKTFLLQHPKITTHWSHMHGFPIKYREYGFDCADFCCDIPDEARKAIQAAKDAALTRAPYNLMRADLKAVGNGGGTIVEQITGAQFGSRSTGGKR